MLRRLFQYLTQPLGVRQACTHTIRLFGILLLLFLLAELSPIDSGSKDAPRKAAHVQVQGIVEALGRFAAHHQGRIPTTEMGLTALIKKPEGDVEWNGPYYKNSSNMPLDPWGTPVRYQTVLAGNRRHSARVWSLGSDGQPDTGDEIRP